MRIKHHLGTPYNMELTHCSQSIPLIDDKLGLDFPEKLEIELTGDCNLNHIHCWNNSHKNNKKIRIII